MNKLLHKDNYRSVVPASTAIFQIMIDRPSKTNPLNREYHLIGSGFFISKFGLFVTAKHVFEDLIDDTPKAKMAHQYMGGSGLVGLVVHKAAAFPCPIHDVTLHPDADVGFGVIAKPNPGPGVPPFAISYCAVSPTEAKQNENVLVYGYQRSHASNDQGDPSTVLIDLNPKYYDGNVLGYHQKGFSIAKWPVYEMSVPIASGISGSPIMRKDNNSVIAVACADWSTSDQDITMGTATDIRLVFDLLIPNNLAKATGQKTVGDLLKFEGHLI